MTYSEAYKGVGYCAEAFKQDSGLYGWGATVGGDRDDSTHSRGLATESAALDYAVKWAKASIDAR